MERTRSQDKRKNIETIDKGEMDRITHRQTPHTCIQVKGEEVKRVQE